MPTPEAVVRSWIDRVWNAEDLEGLPETVATFHPASFTDDGRRSSPADAAAWHSRMRATSWS